MPELPEIEVIRRDLEKEIVGRRIKDVEVRPGSKAMKIVKRHGRRKELQDLLVGAKIQTVSRLGRRILLELDTGNVFVIGLGTSGQLLKTSTSDEMAPHTHIVLEFTIGGQLRMLDPALTGEVFVAPREDVGNGDLRGFAIDPLDNQKPFTWHEFSSLLEQKKTRLRALLTDDKFIVGLGNMYSDEVLFTAGLRHDRESHQLSSQDVRRLYRALMETLQEAVRARGTSWENGFTDLQGNPGQFQLDLKVFGREGEACRRCRSQIVKERVGDGDTYFCPQCQS